ncbi:MAG: putative porin, partial [Endomicrobia bacterium]|nr:putative porin [Endomicrobiia bacterium]
VFANAGWYALGELRERTNTAVKNGMPTLLIAQPGASYSKGDFSAKVGLSLQQFYVKGNTIASNEPGTWWSSGAEIMDYSLVNPGWEIKMKNVVNDYGVSFSGDFVKNVTESATQAINDQNKEGYILCIGIGDDKIGSFGTWQAKGAYRRLDAYAIPTGWGNTDAYSAKPGKGWEYSLALGLLANLSFNLNYYEMTNLDGQAPTRLTQFDFIYKF